MMRFIAIVALALTTVVGATAADRPVAGIAFMNSGGLFGVSPDDSSVSLFRGNTCPGQSSLPCPIVKAMSWSPDGTRLAFTFGTELYLYDSTDGSQRLLPTGVDVGGESRPAWSPDGRELAFPSVLADEGAIAEARPSGGYSSGATTSRSDLYVIHVDTGSVRRLTNGSQTTDPAWAPGSRIVYSSLFQAKWELFIVDGGGHRRLTDGAAASNRRASWSPDGAEIAFLRDAGGLQPRLNAIRPDGSGLRQLSHLPIVDVELGEQPAWSPDGSMIAVSTSLNGRLDAITGNKPGRDIYLVASDGSGERRLTQSGERGVADRGPTWSPDGSQLAFESFDRDKASESALYAANADGRCEMRVSAVGGWRPDWQPIRGSTVVPRTCSDLSLVAGRNPTQGAEGRFRVRLINDGTKPLNALRVRTLAPSATVLSAGSRDAACSVRGGRLECRAASLGVGAVIEIDVLVEARVLVRVGHHRIGPRIEFLGSTRSGEASRGNNNLVSDVATGACTTTTPGAGRIKGTDSDEDICGRKGRDVIFGLAGNDRILGGSGNDVINAGPGKDEVFCGAGSDRVIAGPRDRVAADCERVSRRGN
jgi:Tol biopolymer transport system component